MLQCDSLLGVGQPQLHQLRDLALQPLPADGGLIGIGGLPLQPGAGLLQQLGQRALILRVAEQGLQVLLLQRELACQLPILIGGLSRGAQQGQ
ncbi:hypothetical protein D3C80_1099880 [compost metagenome]